MQRKLDVSFFQAEKITERCEEVVCWLCLGERKALFSIPNGLAHGEYKVCHRLRMCIHESKTTLYNCNICNEERVKGDGVSACEFGEEAFNHIINSDREGSLPFTPSPKSRLMKAIHHF